MIINRTVAAPSPLSAALATTMPGIRRRGRSALAERRRRRASELTLTDAEAAKLKKGKFTPPRCSGTPRPIS